MRGDSAFRNGPFAPADFFKRRQFFVETLKGFDIDHVSRGAPVLRDEDRISVPGHCGNDVRRFALQRRDQFRFHSDTLVSL